MSVTSQPRGLHNFISEIRAAVSKDDERSRVDKELANIRHKFSATANLSSYQKKKYVWKMCYISMLGYDVDFGHMEFISLLSSTKFQEKSVGYMAVSLLLRPTDEMMTLVVNSMRNDIVGPYHHGKTLALAALANIGGVDLAEALSADVQRLITAPIEQNQHSGLRPEGYESNRTLLSKKAALCLLRLFRTNPECVELSDWVLRFEVLLGDRDIGVLNSVMSLLLGFGSVNSVVLEPVVNLVISVLARMSGGSMCSPEYLYYHLPCPWLQVKCLRYLQFYKVRDIDYDHLETLYEVLGRILVKPEVSDSHNKNNAGYSILFEAISLIISFGNDAPEYLRDQVVALLGRFIAVKDANIRYLGLEAMTRLARSDGPKKAQAHQESVLESLRDGDISVRRRALDLIFVLVDETNSEEVVGELVITLSSAQSALKEDMVVKIAILAEKYSPGNKWYVDTMVSVMLVAGDFVAEPVWHRVIMIVTNNLEVHEYAAQKMLESVQNKFCHEVAVALAGYLLGEVGVNICEKLGMGGYDQFAALHQHYHRCSSKTQAILLTTYMKLVNLYPDTKDVILDVFRKYSTSSHLELQQRACEYLVLPTVGQEIMETVMNSMPPYLDKGNALMNMHETEVESSDRSIWVVASKAAGQEDRDRSVSVTVTDREYEAAVIESLKDRADKPSDVVKEMDLLSLGEEEEDEAPVPTSSPRPSASSSHTPPQSSSAYKSPNSPLASQSPPVSPTSEGARGVTGIPPGMAKDVREWFDEAVLTVGSPLRLGQTVDQRKALLFENEIIAISYSADFRIQLGRIKIIFENKNREEQDLRHLVVEVNPSEALTVKTLPPPSTIEGGDEVLMQIAVECMRPFSESPAFTVSFTTATQGRHSYALTLPITAASFFEPLPTDKAAFMTRWKALEGEKGEIQEIISVTQKVDSNFIENVRSKIFPALHIGLALELDSETTITGSCSFRTGTPGADGSPIAVGAMVRLEADMKQNRFRITVRTKHPVVSLALKDILKAQLG